MRALLWKEYRLNRSILGLGSILFIGPYAVIGLAISKSDLPDMTTALTTWAVFLETGSYVSLFCSQVTFFLLGAFIIARERADRSAEFQAYLPPSRTLIVWAKATLLGICVAIVWGVNLAIKAIADTIRDESVSFISDLPSVEYIAILGFLWCGIAWLISSFCESPVQAILIATPSPALVYLLVLSSAYIFGVPSTPSGFLNAFEMTAIVITQGAFALGIYCYTNRIKP